MKKIKKNLLILSLFVFFIKTVTAQNKILVAKYSLFPYSEEYFERDKDKPKDFQSFALAMRKTLEYQYTLMIDEKNKQAVFYLDTLIVRKVKGKEDFWTEAENKMSYAFRKRDGFYAKESLFQSELYLFANKSFNYEWDIRNETKKINGITCQKAISNLKGNKVIAWFAKDIPVSYGPLNYWGLPGLIVQVENFFSTVTLTDLKYSDNSLLFKEKMNLYESKYNASKKSNQTELFPFLLSKGALIKQLKRP
ncbi:GLPGLI family protein [Riemerella anatipestifer]|uniref:GLPGLI family protein n=1 Tax=Riemerella anatipestifer TaxID=34085 RepID=UPI0012ADDE0F|nr:GLPGLI family protein [Riemerella anatipestifer]MCO7318917.1 GLPGLI family protein [Riemerella anatipestifer]MCQ4155202.1 GLPGLI family protein [Riemerella anatipestifer]MCQ4181189.1 GLPGLI family protein [Riemerella anatipestifer]MCW0474396.1 GLPGLI family protein [Riemerella anatipestifer]MDR7775307.1 GLPGLI family protein [Riemerella anatipestifer]